MKNLTTRNKIIRIISMERRVYLKVIEIREHCIRCSQNNKTRNKPVLSLHSEQFHRSSFYYHLHFASFPTPLHAETISTSNHMVWKFGINLLNLLLKFLKFNE